MAVVGLRELRQDASGLVRRVAAVEEITVTVSGRPRARLVPVPPRQWRSYAEVKELFDGPGDTQWASDRDRLGHELVEPWSR